MKNRIDGKKIFAYGFSEYDAAEVRMIGGHRSSEIEKILGYCSSQEVIHRNNLVLKEDS